MRFVALLVVMTLAVATTGCTAPRVAPTRDPGRWVIEQMPGGTVRVNGDALEIEDAQGCTVWWKQRLTAPVRIRYEVTVVSAGGPHDRVSDVNCFWMAQEPGSPEPPFAGGRRQGKFEQYDSLRTYYVGFGGNNNTTTRFRRYDRGARPLLPGHDLRAPEFLLQPNRTYRIELVAKDGQAEFYRDGERLFRFTDPEPLTHGWFGLRTVKSHLLIRNVRIETAE